MLIKPLYVSPERFVMQIDKTIWTLERGKQFARVQHPTTELGYTRGTCFYSDNTNSNPSADTAVEMFFNSYCLIWNRGSGTCDTPDPAVDLRLMIIKTSPTAIMSDSLLPDAMTGIGFFDSTLEGSDHNSYLNISREFFIQPRTNIALKGI
jgi:hypothetical protein